MVDVNARPKLQVLILLPQPNTCTKIKTTITIIILNKYELKLSVGLVRFITEFTFTLA